MKKLFLESWPHGNLRVVDVIEERKELSTPERKSYFIRYSPGSTDTTTSDFLFDIPESLIEQERISKFASCVVKTSNELNVEDYDAPHNWLVACIGITRNLPEF